MNGSYGLVEIKLGGETLIKDGVATLIELAGKIDTELPSEAQAATIFSPSCGGPGVSGRCAA